MKINLKIIFSNLILILIISLNFKHVRSSENRIIFKINDNVFTLLDLEKREDYLDFVGSNNDIDKDIILNDFISANLFYEYYKNTNRKIDYSKKLEEIYLNILDANKQNNKYKINKSEILENIKLDFIRKIILENILNTSLSNFKTSNEENDLLYSFKIKYVNFDTENINILKDEIKNQKINNFENLKAILNKKNIKYFVKEKEVNNINKIDKRIKENILSNKNFMIIEKNNDLSVIFIEKKFETFDGIIVRLYSLRSLKELEDDFLKCNNLQKLKDYPNLIDKEYKLIDLNNELKKKLINVDDNVKFLSDNEFVYIILCNIKFDKEILDSINLNKTINLNISKIEKQFINKYSKIYNLILIDE